MKTIYITGIAGLMGSNLAKHFIKNGYKVKGCDNMIGGYEDNIPLNYVDYKEIDIHNLDELKEHMSGSDVVLHTAALAYEGLSVFSPSIITNNIYSGTVNVATAAIHNNVELFINFSSMARYGDLDPPFKETDVCKPTDPYGMAKYQAEQMLNLLSDIHGLKVFHVVPHNIIGPGQRYNDPFRNVAAIMINRLLQRKHLIIYGDGEQKRSFSDVKDCVEPVLRLVESDRFKSGEVFNIGPDDNEITIKELGYTCGRVINKYPHFDHFPDRPREVKNAWCSSDKARLQLNYNPSPNIEGTIKNLAEWIKKRGPRDFDYHLPLELEKENTPETWKKKLI